MVVFEINQKMLHDAYASARQREAQAGKEDARSKKTR